MSILSKIGKIAGIVGGVAGIPFTGGTSLLGTIGSIASAVSPVLGGMAGASSDSKVNQANSNAAADRNNLERFKVNQALPQSRLNTGLKASRTANAQPVKFNWQGPGSVARGQQASFSGGYNNPNLISGDVRTMADDIAHKQMMDQLSGVEAPMTSTYPKTTGLDKAIGGGAAISSLIAALNASKKKQAGVMTGMPTPYDPNMPDPSGY